MSRYYDTADIPSLLKDYPIGDAFLAGPAQLSRDALHELQNRRFLELLARAWQIPFYQRHWGGVGLEKGDICGLEDIANIPPFGKEEIMASIDANPPFGDFHGVDFSASDRPPVVMHTTSGTTGAPQTLLFGAYDREVQNALLARAYYLQGLRSEDIIHSVYGFGMVNGGHYIREAVLHFTDCLLLPAGTGLETPSATQVHLMQRFGATVLVGFADYLKRLAQVAVEEGLQPGGDLPIRMISGHLGQEDRQAMSDLWGGAAVYDWYGVGDTGIIAAEGPDQDGLHIWEDAHLVEILDPTTGSVVAEGDPGDICITVLFKKDVYPIIRFNTHDVSQILPANGQVGPGFRRLAGFQGRSDNMVKLRGINVYPTAIGAMLEDMSGLTGEYVCKHQQQGIREELTIMIEAEARFKDDPDFMQRVKSQLREKIGVEVSIELVDPGATAALTQIETRQKPIRLIKQA